MVDQEMTGWLEVHDWLRALTFPTDFEEYTQLGQLNKFTSAANSKTPQYADGSITILSAANKPYFRFNFYNLFPIAIGGFMLSSTDTPETIITSDATFRFTYYNIEKLI